MHRCIVVLACLVVSLLTISVSAHADDESPVLDGLITSPAPEPDPLPVPVTEPAPAPEPDPLPEPVPAPEPEPLPAPASEPVPGPVVEPPAPSSPAADVQVFPVPLPVRPNSARLDVPLPATPSAVLTEAVPEHVAGAEETSAAAVIVAPEASKAAGPTSLPQPVTTTIDAVVATATGSPLHVQILTVTFLLAAGVLYFRVLGTKSRNPAKMGKQPAP